MSRYSIIDSSAPPARRSRFAPRFSLGALLAVFTAFAIGFPVCYRWPYQESVEESITLPADPFRAPPKPTSSKRIVITTWQRQWGGGRKKHGPERTLVNGQLLSLETFSHDQLHGPCEYRGTLTREAGQYAYGKKEGVWTLIDAEDRVLTTSTWHENQLDGPYEVHLEDGNRFLLEFAAGRLTKANGAPIHNRLLELLAEGSIDSPRARSQLTLPTEITFVRTPLRDGVEFLAEKHDLRIMLDPRHAKFERPVTGDWREFDLASALTIISAMTGHCCDYRYGCIWITSLEDAKGWRDPTGVGDIHLPPDSQLAKVWDEPVDINVIRMPLAQALAKTTKQLAIELDATALHAVADGGVGFPVTERIKGHPFRHELGILLYQALCRCEVRGETLVVLPPE